MTTSSLPITSGLGGQIWQIPVRSSRWMGEFCGDGMTCFRALLLSQASYRYLICYVPSLLLGSRCPGLQWVLPSSTSTTTDSTCLYHLLRNTVLDGLLKFFGCFEFASKKSHCLEISLSEIWGCQELFPFWSCCHAPTSPSSRLVWQLLTVSLCFLSLVIPFSEAHF